MVEVAIGKDHQAKAVRVKYGFLHYLMHDWMNRHWSWCLHYLDIKNYGGEVVKFNNDDAGEDVEFDDNNDPLRYPPQDRIYCTEVG